VRAHGFGVTTARQLGLERATDARQFLTAIERGWMMITHNESHYEEFPDAWHRWGHLWGVHRPHYGVVVLPSKPLPFVQELFLALLMQETIFMGMPFLWRFSTGWQTLPYRP
jgi:hypothetical protein